MTKGQARAVRNGTAALMLLPLTASCVTVSTPDKPIEINLNVRIEQEVLVRLQRDVEDIIRNNPDAFPQQQQPTGGAPRR